MCNYCRMSTINKAGLLCYVGALSLALLTSPVQTRGQRGGKAEPLKILFAAGKTSTTLAGRLSNDQEMEYVFSARKGQRVTVRNAQSHLFDVRIFRSEGD